MRKLRQRMVIDATVVLLCGVAIGLVTGTMLSGPLSRDNISLGIFILVVAAVWGSFDFIDLVLHIINLTAKDKSADDYLPITSDEY